MLYVIAFALILFPTVTYAQSVQELLTGVMGFITVVLIPFILGVAFLVFAVNAVRFFVIGGDNTESQENAKSLALYGIGAFVIILSLWGIVNLIANGIGLNEGNCIDGDTIQSDYIDSNPPCSSPRPRSRPTNLNTGGSNDAYNPYGNGPITDPISI
jgi:succinate dehydrogenase/fumarate reductase cytochrome b subunit